MGARHTATFCAAGCTTPTWQAYRPGSSAANGTLKRSGTAFDLAFSPSNAFRGSVSNAFTPPRKKLTVAARVPVLAAPGW